MEQNRNRSKSMSILVFSIVVLSLVSTSSSSSCKAWLVQSIPTDMPDLAPVPGVLSTADVFQWIAGNSTESLDIIAQYWQFVPGTQNKMSGDYGYSDEDMERFGADNGQKVYKSLENAADRKVGIRIVQHSGVFPDFDQESAKLAAGRPNVQNVTLLFRDWWGSGIVHAKVWISDKEDVYIGSANNDWKSLTQVKEVGVYMVGCPSIAKQVEVYFNNLWTLSSLNSSEYTRNISDNTWQAARQVPCWSHFIRPEERCKSPLPSPSYIDIPHVNGYPILTDPYMFQMPIDTPGYLTPSPGNYSSYLSFAPPELSFGMFQADEQGWLDTIRSVKFGGEIRINTMDWLGQSQYTKHTIYWSALSSAISEAVFSKNASVKLMVAYWSHFIRSTDKYLKSLLYSNVLCNSSKYNECGGNLQIKYFKVPGFEHTGPAILHGNSTKNVYPGYSRVNHGKYAVTDVRAHIGTSNLIWDYFYTTAGVSFGTYHPSIVSQLQQVFDADWNSPYAVNVQPLQVGNQFDKSSK